MTCENKDAQACKEARELTNIDILVILQEINSRLVEKHARLDQIYQLEDSHFVFRFKTNDGKKDLVFNPPKFLFLRECEKIEGQLNQFVSVLKNYFLNRILKSANQIQNDRIISLEFEEGSIILELIRKGNIIAVKNEKIVALDENEKIRERVLRLNEKYYPPPSQKKKATKQNIIESIIGKEKLVVSITRNIAVPAFYVNELLEGLGLDPKDECSTLDRKDIENIGERIERFVSNIKEGKTEAVEFESKYLAADNELKEQMVGKGEFKKLNSLSEILNSLYTVEAYERNKKAKEKKMVKLLSRLKHQEIRARQVETEIEEERRKGEWIISNIEMIDSLIQEYRKIKASKNMDALEEFLKKNNATITKHGIKLNV